VGGQAHSDRSFVWHNASSPSESEPVFTAPSISAVSFGRSPIKTPIENTVIARAWHEEVINRRNPAILQDILAADVVHHAAGGYPKVMNATGIMAMMADFLTAFPDRRYSFDQFIVQDDYVVECYTAMGTQQGQFGDLPPSSRMATWTGINTFALERVPADLNRGDSLSGLAERVYRH
jgi:hypothetical protein